MTAGFDGEFNRLINLGAVRANGSEAADSENLEKVASGNDCKTCGCPEDKMPMVFRGTGWCCELHRKEQQEETKGNV